MVQRALVVSRSGQKPRTVYMRQRPDGQVEWQCDCPGFAYKDKCRHIKIVADATRAGLLTMEQIDDHLYA